MISTGEAMVTNASLPARRAVPQEDRETAARAQTAVRTLRTFKGNLGRSPCSEGCMGPGDASGSTLRRQARGRKSRLLGTGSGPALTCPEEGAGHPAPKVAYERFRGRHLRRTAIA